MSACLLGRQKRVKEHLIQEAAAQLKVGQSVFMLSQLPHCACSTLCEAENIFYSTFLLSKPGNQMMLLACRVPGQNQLEWDVCI